MIRYHPGQFPPMRDLATELHLTVGALYRYFSGRDELTALVALRCEERLKQELTGHTGFVARLTHALDVAPGWLWAITDAASGHPPSTTGYAVLTGSPLDGAESPTVAHPDLLLGYIGDAWRYTPDLEHWRAAILGAAPDLVGLIDATCATAPMSGRPPRIADPDLILADVAHPGVAGDPIVRAYFNALIETGAPPPIRRISLHWGRAPSSMYPRTNHDDVVNKAGDAFHQAVLVHLKDRDDLADPLVRLTAWWMLALDSGLGDALVGKFASVYPTPFGPDPTLDEIARLTALIRAPGRYPAISDTQIVHVLAGGIRRSGFRNRDEAEWHSRWTHLVQALLRQLVDVSDS